MGPHFSRSASERCSWRAKLRDPHFLLEHVNYTTYWSMRAIWRDRGLSARNVTAELAHAGRHPSAIYRQPVTRSLVLGLRLFPNVSWLVRKPAS